MRIVDQRPDLGLTKHQVLSKKVYRTPATSQPEPQYHMRVEFGQLPAGHIFMINLGSGNVWEPHADNRFFEVDAELLVHS